MRIYLAAQYSWRDVMRLHAKTLRKHGHTVMSSWLKERSQLNSDITPQSNKNYLERNSIRDANDIENCDVLILFSIDPTSPSKRGGRHWETGFAYAKEKLICVCGPRENIFHYLPGVLQFDTFDDVLLHLDFLSQIQP